MARSRAARIAVVVVLVVPAGLVALVAVVVGAMAAFGGARSDQRSPLATDYLVSCGAGVVAVLVLATWWLTRPREWPFEDKSPVPVIAAVTVLAVVVCTVPLWKRYNTIDVTPFGFSRAAYTFSGTFRIWNGTGERLRVCVGDTGTCAEGRPVRLLEPGEQGRIGGTIGAGRHILTIAGPGPWARRDTRVTVEESKSDDDSYSPSFPSQPYVPPPYFPPQAPMVPYR